MHGIAIRNAGSEQYDDHVWMRDFYIQLTREWRYWRVFYRGKITRMTQLNQLRERGEMKDYGWLKDLWRRQLTRNRETA